MSDLKLMMSKTNEVEIAAIDGLDLNPIEQELFQIDLGNAEAVEAYNLFSSNLEARAEFYKKQADEFYKIATSITGLANRYEAFVKKIMVESGNTDINGKSFRFKLSTTKPKLIIDNEDAVKAVYSKTETKVLVDKEAAKQDLELGVPVEGAHLEQSYSLRRYPIKELK